MTALRPTFRLAKLEGDAAFTYAIAERLDGSMLLDTIERCYFGFRRRRRDVRQATSCPCDACVRIPDLDLKFVVHHGQAILQKVAGRQELLGSDVIVVHRLLKNTVVEDLGMDAYALISQACIDVTDLDPAALGMRPHTETYDRIGDVPAWAHDLERRWQEEEERARVFVTPEEAILDLSVPTSVPPQVAWAFLTQPGPADELAALGDRGRGQGHDRRPPRAGLVQPLHARQGRGRRGDPRLAPYDYVTDRTVLATPGGLVKLLHTSSWSRAPTGRLSTSATPRRRRSASRCSWGASGTRTGRRSRSSFPSLIAQLDEALASREAGGGPEPELAKPRPDGPLSGLAPLQMVD